MVSARIALTFTAALSARRFGCLETKPTAYMQTKRPAIWRMCGGCGAASGRQGDAELARARLRMNAVLQRALGDRDGRPLNATKPHAKLRRATEV